MTKKGRYDNKKDEIEVNGKKYVLKKDNRPNLRIGKTFLLDNINVMGVGDFKVENYVCTRVSLNYLKKAIKIIEALEIEKDTFIFAWGEDYPLIIAKEEDVKGDLVKGIVIAPKVENY